MQKTWELEDVTKIAKNAPYTFYIPSNAVLESLSVGNIVKLMFSCDVENDKGWSAERMWVIITKKEGSKYTGTLDNDPYYIPDLKYQEVIEFDETNIMQTDIKDTAPNLVEKYLPRCYVTSEVLKELKPVGQLYREQPEESEENYSGWNIFSGEETEEYLNDSGNWNYVSLGAVLNKCSRFIDVLDLEDYKNEYVWSENTQSYKKI
ncbi:DUF2185 domain-containing protein [Teredinibacter turnerae]|uniref:immunity protein Imm33 domain-containing protein n=1 Tax=Teredinibacter turnerae TaxID=2426 RepID=UPI001E43BBDF|nr:DUF2185 domain-containing protein [Teredinibacter turnerae]